MKHEWVNPAAGFWFFYVLITFLSLCKVECMLSENPFPELKQGWRAESLPLPRRFPDEIVGNFPKKLSESVSPSEISSVCDPDNYLSLFERQELENTIRRIAQGSSNMRVVQCGNGETMGADVALVVLSKLHEEELTADASFRWHHSHGPISTEGKRAAFRSFAIRLGNRWNIGSSTCPNGILLLVSINDRYAYLLTGTAVKESVISDEGSSAIIDKMKTPLRMGSYKLAFISALVELERHLSLQQSSHAMHRSTIWEMILFGLGIPFFLPLALIMFVSLSRRRQRQAYWGNFYQLFNNVWTSARPSIPQTTCSICLESLSTEAANDPSSVASEGKLPDSSSPPQPSSQMPPMQSEMKPDQINDYCTTIEANTEGELSSSDSNKAARDSRLVEAASVEAASVGQSSNRSQLQCDSPPFDKPVSSSVVPPHERTDEVATLPCGHCFHRACLRKWFAADYQIYVCPICRSSGYKQTSRLPTMDCRERVEVDYGLWSRFLAMLGAPFTRFSDGATPVYTHCPSDQARMLNNDCTTGTSNEEPSRFGYSSGGAGGGW